MSRAILGLVAALAATPVQAAQDGALSGTYLMRGRGFGLMDSAYEGTCTFKGDGPVYDVSCFNNATRHTYVGRGLLAGGALAITIGDYLRGDHGGVYVGEYLVLYTRRPDGTFEGKWVAAGGANGRETLTPLD